MPSILIYKTANETDLQNWKFLGALYQESSLNATTIECPNLAKISNENNKYALIYSVQLSNDEHVTYARVGHFDEINYKFISESGL